MATVRKVAKVRKVRKVRTVRTLREVRKERLITSTYWHNVGSVETRTCVVTLLGGISLQLHMDRGPICSAVACAAVCKFPDVSYSLRVGVALNWHLHRIEITLNSY